MKRVVLAVALMFILTIGANAGVKPAAYLGIGLGMPMGPDEFKDFQKMGLNFNGGVGFEVSPMFEIVGKLAYNTFPLDDDAIIEELEAEFGEDLTGLTLDGGTLNAFEFGADVKLLIPTGGDGMAFSPYIVAGGGMTSLSYSDLTATYEGESATLPVDESTTDFSINFGAGFTYMFSAKIGMFLDARYVMIMTEGDTGTFIPFRGGIKIGFGGE
jgi:hypothetical protein